MDNNAVPTMNVFPVFRIVNVLVHMLHKAKCYVSHATSHHTMKLHRPSV